MRRTRAMFVAAVALCAVAALAIRAGAQETSPVHRANFQFQDHVDNAKLLAAGDLPPEEISLTAVCRPNSAAPTGEPIVAPPTKVFDQLYYLGMNSVASWALVTWRCA